MPLIQNCKQTNLSAIVNNVHHPQMIQETRARWAFLLIFLFVVGLSVTYSGLFEGLGSRRGWIEGYNWGRCPPTNAGESTGEPVLEEWDSSRVLKGNLTSKFRGIFAYP